MNAASVALLNLKKNKKYGPIFEHFILLKK